MAPTRQVGSKEFDQGSRIDQVGVDRQAERLACFQRVLAPLIKEHFERADATAAIRMLRTLQFSDEDIANDGGRLLSLPETKPLTQRLVRAMSYELNDKKLLALEDRGFRQALENVVGPDDGDRFEHPVNPDLILSRPLPPDNRPAFASLRDAGFSLDEIDLGLKELGDGLDPKMLDALRCAVSYARYCDDLQKVFPLPVTPWNEPYVSMVLGRSPMTTQDALAAPRQRDMHRVFTDFNGVEFHPHFGSPKTK